MLRTREVCPSPKRAHRWGGVTQKSRHNACWPLLTTSEILPAFHPEKNSRKSLFHKFLPINLRASNICGENCAKVLKTKYRSQKFFVICVTNLTRKAHSGNGRFDYQSANRRKSTTETPRHRELPLFLSYSLCLRASVVNLTCVQITDSPRTTPLRLRSGQVTHTEKRGQDRNDG